jgi:hypothetical protein
MLFMHILKNWYCCERKIGGFDRKSEFPIFLHHFFVECANFAHSFLSRFQIERKYIRLLA